MSTLTDKEIRLAIENGHLVHDGELSQASGACYELRLGDVYYDLTEENRRISIPEGAFALIKPGHRVVLITYEELALSDDMFARIVCKGSLFSIGLSPVSTYADPGFRGVRRRNEWDSRGDYLTEALAHPG